MILFDALRIYLAAWLQAFTRSGRRHAPLGLRRVLFLVCAPAGLVLFALHGLCLALDELLYPAFRRTAVRGPVFILGVPRSGTTYLHRELAEDSRFATTATWELLLAPAICQRRAISLLLALDRALGAPLARLGGLLERRLASPMDSVHSVGLEAAEEDYLALLPAAGCFFASLAFPGSRALRDLAHPQDIPRERRERLLAHYHGLIQRHLFHHGKTLFLSKNAAFASWLPYLAERYGDGRFVLCIRDPASALSSQLSSLAGARSLFATYGADDELAERFAAHYARWFDDLATWQCDGDNPGLVVDQGWLRHNSEGALAAIYDALGLAAVDRPPVPDGSAATAQSPPHRHSAADWNFPEEQMVMMTSAYRRLRHSALDTLVTP